VTRVLEAMGATSPSPATLTRPLFLKAGDPAPAGAKEVLVEGGGSSQVAGRRLPRDLPHGYHRLLMKNGREVALVVSPGRCHLPGDLKTWGWAAQLYAVRSRQSWGIGDLGDLRRLARWSTGAGAGFVLVNPLHAPMPVPPQQPSPYFPSSRRYRNPVYLRIEDVPGARGLRQLPALAQRGRALNQANLVDRDRAWALKMEALVELWTAFLTRAAKTDTRSFDRFREEKGESLRQYAWFCVLAECFGGGWRRWPEEFRHPASQAVARFATYRRDRVGFHEWLQWLLDRQLRSAAAPLALIHDLATGFDPDGADAWAWQDVLAPEVSIGAPPDAFNLEGQDWGLPPFDPHKLPSAGYLPFIETLRASMSHGAGLRIDHVMGLFRLWWIPSGHGAADGAYVRYPASEILDILALESSRAGAYVVGEDLGNVEPGVRKELARRAVMSSRVFWFERKRPARYPRLALAAVTTHDLPTVAGLWTGSDLRAREELGLKTNRAAQERIKRRLVRHLEVGPRATVEDVIVCAHVQLAQSPSHLLAATLDDACAAEARPNMPGTTTQWPNWSIPLPRRLEQIEKDPLPRRLATVLARPPVGAETTADDGLAKVSPGSPLPRAGQPGRPIPTCRPPAG
jgi:4-alpha-glucanotransferase